MASTVEKPIVIRNNTKKLPFPVYTGQTIYHGCIGVVSTNGYLYNMSSSITDPANINYIGIVYDETVNTTGTPAAVTASGSITGQQEIRSAIAGDATVRTLYLDGQFYATMSGLTQANCGDIVYVTDNFTFATSGTIAIGTISKVLAATLAEIDLNCYTNASAVNTVTDKTLLPVKVKEVTSGIGIPFIIEKLITTGSANEYIWNATCPFALEILDVVVQPQGASTNGTMKLASGAGDITNAMTAAADKTIARAGTIDNAYSTLAAGDTLKVVCAGDSAAATVGLVTITAVRR
jgi:hypothetical protein